MSTARATLSRKQRKGPIQKATRIRNSPSERIAPYAYVAPFFIIFLVFGLFPLLFTFYVSLFDWNPIGKQTFVGLANFEQLFADGRFWNALLNTFGIFLISTIPQLLLALAPSNRSTAEDAPSCASLVASCARLASQRARVGARLARALRGGRVGCAWVRLGRHGAFGALQRFAQGA